MIKMDIQLPVVEIGLEDGDVSILEADENPTGRNYRHLWYGSLREFFDDLDITKEDCLKAFEEKES